MARKTKGEYELACRQVAGSTTQHRRLCVGTGSESDNSADSIAVRICSDQFDPQTPERRRIVGRNVEKQRRPIVVGCKHKVEASIVIDVGVSGTTTDALRREAGA